ncbi:hypothetical protein N7451_010596 [Penicillium sp. IBT 35674x]|nr:hypothetical protein N7451_010596 [Penicillium sp. IBT 35674x]
MKLNTLHAAIEPVVDRECGEERAKRSAHQQFTISYALAGSSFNIVPSDWLFRLHMVQRHIACVVPISMRPPEAHGHHYGV